MKNLTKKQKIIIMLELICIITLAIIFAIIYFQDDNTQTNTSDVTETIDNSNTNIPQYIADLKSQVEKDEADYGNDYKEFSNIGYKRKPDRIIFKSGSIYLKKMMKTLIIF